MTIHALLGEMLNTQIQLLPLTAAPETAQYDRYTYTTFELQLA